MPYFSWQRSHAVHHNRTNHITEGETHVPDMSHEPAAEATLQARVSMGDGPFAILHTGAPLPSLPLPRQSSPLGVNCNASA